MCDLHLYCSGYGKSLEEDPAHIGLQHTADQEMHYSIYLELELCMNVSPRELLHLETKRFEGQLKFIESGVVETWMRPINPCTFRRRQFLAAYQAPHPSSGR